jgi:hypothetical protein
VRIKRRREAEEIVLASPKKQKLKELKPFIPGESLDTLEKSIKKDIEYLNSVSKYLGLRLPLDREGRLNMYELDGENLYKRMMMIQPLFRKWTSKFCEMYDVKNIS